ncbi:MAG TPA: hypothetical protein VFL83_21650 [Anaeromyxobacter sp.]|nr:hypothetical protein [Anaeromyxobacter sp.]
MTDTIPLATGALAASIGSVATNDELQSLVVALLALIVREVIYWWRNRRKPT